jgi:4-hydroxy-tetrahydrodipicolinate reductase
MKTKIAILGHGRMGRSIQSCLLKSDEMQIGSVWTRNIASDNGKEDYLASDNLALVLQGVQVAVDFTLATVTDRVIDAVSRAKIPLVCGVSGLSEATLENMAAASTKIPILYDRNMSMGVAVLQKLVHRAGVALGELFEAEIHETHHVHKLDAPSGTALLLGEVLAASRGRNFADVYHFEKNGNHTPASGDIRFVVTRQGEVPGEHSVEFKTGDESLSLTHKVANRRVFAVGALAAASWLVNRAPGLYSMQDLVAETGLAGGSSDAV